APRGALPQGLHAYAQPGCALSLAALAAETEIAVNRVTQVLLTAALAAGFCGARAQSPASQNQNDDQRTVIKQDVDLVSIYFTVRDNHKQLISSLTQEQFRVTEDGREQQIKFFAHHSNVPLNVGILLDTGTSMGRTLSMEADASSLFLERVVRPSDL